MLWAAGLLALTGLAAAIGLSLQDGDAPGTGRLQPLRALGLQRAPTVAPEPPPPPRLTPDTDYYLLVRSLQARPSPEGRDHWDRLDHSGPDLYYELHWQGNHLFTSPERSNALIAAWDLLSVDVRELLNNGGEVDLESIINAPVIRYTRGGPKPKLYVYDNDPLSGDDELGTVTLPLDDAEPGVNHLEFDPDAPDAPAGLERLTYVLIDRRVTLPELVQLVSRRAAE